MAHPALFVGVVSHEGSRFSVSQGRDGLARQLASVIADCEVRVNTVDMLDESVRRVGPSSVQETLTAELKLDRRWSSFLGKPMRARWWTIHTLRIIRRGWLRLRPPGPAMVRRLLNIELSHLDLMRRGLESGAPWVLILEDDAFTSDITDLSVGMRELLVHSPAPAFVNLSQSFDLDELGIDHLLAPVGGVTWGGPTPRRVVGARRPVTNTVCAILYSRDFLMDLVAAFDALPMEPVVPIDWKLNLALMDMFDAGQIGPGECWLVEPAPITQMSMQPTGILPS